MQCSIHPDANFKRVRTSIMCKCVKCDDTQREWTRSPNKTSGYHCMRKVYVSVYLKIRTKESNSK